MNEPPLVRIIGRSGKRQSPTDETSELTIRFNREGRYERLCIDCG